MDGPHGPVPVRRYSPPTDVTATDAVPIVWVHGGAFVSGGLDQSESDAVARSLARAGFPVTTVGYRLAPRVPGLRGFRYPVPVDDVVAVVNEVVGTAPSGVILGGASSGACLVAAAVLRRRESGTGGGVRGVFLAYGTFHALMPRRAPELVRRLRGYRRYTHVPRLVRLMNLNYAGTRAALLLPDAFPGGHPPGDFPPTLFIDADRDALRASGGEFARELTDAAVPVEYHVLPDIGHAFFDRPEIPEFAQGIRLIVEWARRH
ncbi:alpha/beta hydrolase [Glaciihabitans sp. dw_435]|uniref:alpha/beta hydrolase n=1 Tax=Glaciihabitans sp. dw_435 TaxID=2720081 RepID=UPI0027DE8C0E|nr:alpha/beta hydrolase [Glaciihabitans sp. dw_435]